MLRAHLAPKSSAEPIRGFHGSPKVDIETFDPDAYRLGSKGDSSALGTFFTTDARLGKDAAQTYARDGGRVYEVEVRGRLYNMTDAEFAGLGSRADFRAFRDRLAQEGYDGVRIPEKVSQAGEIAVWNPGAVKIIRSVPASPRCTRMH